MGLLAQGLPPAQRRKYVEGNLVPGCVIRIEVQFPQKKKPKFLVLVGDEDPDYWLFIVNSELHPYISGHPALLKCQVRLEAAEHEFLDRDSHMGCHQIWRLRREDVIRELVNDVSGLQGNLSEEAKAQMVAAVKYAPTLSNAEKAKILGSFVDE